MCKSVSNLSERKVMRVKLIKRNQLWTQSHNKKVIKMTLKFLYEKIVIEPLQKMNIKIKFM